MRNKLLKGLVIGFCATLAMGLVACGDGGGGGGDGGGGDNSDLNGGKALNYTLLEDGTYGVRIGECYDVPEITIPAKYQGKKVTTIMPNFFEVQDTSDEEELTEILTYSIILSEGITTIQNNAFTVSGYNLYKLKRLELAKSVASIGVGNYGGLYEIYNKGNLPLTDENSKANYGYIANQAVNVYTPNSGERKVTMDENGMVTYVDEEGKKALMTYCGTESVLNVPADIDYIFQTACYANANLKEINIPSTCKEIGDTAFGECVNIEYVNIAEGVETIGSAFSAWQATNLIYVNVPGSVTSLHRNAFYSTYTYGTICYYYKQNEFPTGWNAPDSQNNRLTLYDVKGVEKTTDGFIYAERSTDVALLKYVGNASEVVIADTYKEKPVTYLHREAFFGNKDLTKLTVGNNVEKIGKFVFQRCKNLFEVILSDSVTGVAEYAFADCENLVKLTIGANVQNMCYTSGMPAFSGCYRLTEVYNRSTYERALTDLEVCGGVEPERIYTVESTSNVTVENGLVLYTDGDVCRAVNYIGTETEITIPDKVTEIKPLAFYGKTAITKVTIGGGVKIISEKVFTGCSSLTDVTISTSVEKIDYAAFNCSKLKEIKYLGTKAQWADIEKYSDQWGSWYNYNVLEKVICSDGEVTP